MLSKPENGWTTVTIKDFESEAGYLVDIPFEWLKACLNGFQNKIPISFFIDEEVGNECFITSYYDVTHIIVDRGGKVICHTYRDIDFMDLTNLLIADIKKYFDDWVSWSPYEDTDKDIPRRRIELSKLIKDVEKAMEPETKRYNKKY